MVGCAVLRKSRYRGRPESQSGRQLTYEHEVCLHVKRDGFHIGCLTINSRKGNARRGFPSDPERADQSHPNANKGT